MTPTTGLIVLVGSTLVLWLVLIVLAVARKLRRDRRELRSIERRARNEVAIRSHDGTALAAICKESLSVEAQVDLAVSIDAVHASLSRAQICTIGHVMGDSPLFRSLSNDLRARDPIIRARAALLLTRPGIPAVVDQIIPLLGDPDPDVRMVACSGLARAGTARAAEALIWGLVLHVVPPERIIERLGAHWAVDTILLALEDGPSPVPELLAGENSHNTENLDASLARALGLAGDSRGSSALVTLVHSDLEEVRISAARALGRVGLEPSVLTLIDALASDTWPVRAQAAKSLGMLRATDALVPLEACLSDQAWWVRANAASALREIGQPGIEALERTLEHADAYAVDRAREQLALHSVIREWAAA